MIWLVFLAPMVTANGVNIGNVYKDCTDKAALSVLRSSKTDDQVADFAMQKCRYLEPRLKEGLDLSWRRDRDGKVSSPPSDLSRLMTEESWPRLLQAKRARLIQDVHDARRHFKIGSN